MDFFHYPANNERNYSYNSNHNIYNNNCNFIMPYKYRTSGILILICMLLLSSFLKFVITIASL